MNALENGAIKYQIDFERYKNGRANEIIALLDKADAEIAAYIKKTDGIYTKARYKEIAKKLREISKKLKESVEENTDVDAVIEYELKKEQKLLDLVKNDIAKVGAVNYVFPTAEQISTAALFKPAANITYQSYLDGIEAGLYNTWDSAVRTGYLTGKPTKQIVSDVIGGISPESRLKNPGQINTLRNSIYANTRTLLQSFAETTREQVYRDNEKYFGNGKDDYKYEWLSTLDSHTCLVCGNLDGKLFKKIEDAQPIPRHRNCRCLLLPYFDIEGQTRSSPDGYVDSKITFEDWLSKQDERTQKEVLGKTRYELYKKGVSISQFLDNGKVITFEQLRKNLDNTEKADYARESIVVPDKVKEFELKISNNNKEKGLVYTADGKEYILPGEEDRINLSQIDKSLYKDCIFTHNHPKGSPVSSEDIYYYNKYKMGIHRTVGIYKGNKAVIQIYRDKSKPNMTSEFLPKIKTAEYKMNQQMKLMDALIKKQKLSDYDIVTLYTSILDEMFEFYKNESIKYNYVTSIMGLKI